MPGFANGYCTNVFDEETGEWLDQPIPGNQADYGALCQVTAQPAHQAPAAIALWNKRVKARERDQGGIETTVITLQGIFPGICDLDVDECASQPCTHNLPCHESHDHYIGIDIYECACPPGATGWDCEFDVNECESTPCKHGGTCVDTTFDVNAPESGFLCHCLGL